jgi:hypothetical protein
LSHSSVETVPSGSLVVVIPRIFTEAILVHLESFSNPSTSGRLRSVSLSVNAICWLRVFQPPIRHRFRPLHAAPMPLLHRFAVLQCSVAPSWTGFFPSEASFKLKVVVAKVRMFARRKFSPTRPLMYTHARSPGHSCPVSPPCTIETPECLCFSPSRSSHPIVFSRPSSHTPTRLHAQARSPGHSCPVSPPRTHSLPPFVSSNTHRSPIFPTRSHGWSQAPLSLSVFSALPSVVYPLITS